MEVTHASQTFEKGSFNSRDYALIEKIGEGGFGQVYKAIQHSTQKYVAIKFLTLCGDADQDKNLRHIARFHRESDLIRRLNHPNIVQLIDKGQQDDSVIYAVYEFIDGHTLKEHLDINGPLSAVDASQIMACVLDALSHAHQEGVIHRDIKPANIMLYKVGAKTHVKVLDFGIGTLHHDARQLDYQSITLTQETLGTPTYSAPEQLRGEPPVPATDIYVWGLVFLECLTGVPTFTGSTLAAIFHQQLSPSNVPLGVLAGHRSAGLFRRVLSKKPHERPADTAKLYHEFSQLNFANLVGELLSTEHSQRPTTLAETQIVNNDDTLIHAGRWTYSTLTERKPISVLSVILTLETLPDAHPIEQDLIDTFQSDQMQQCIDIAIRYGANHVGSLGDTLLFYFGYPVASENDSRLCSRTALDIASNFNKKNKLLKHSHGIVSQVQMGIDIGLMVSLAHNLPEGSTAHQAMTLCRKALPGQVLCSEQAKLILTSHANFESVIPQAPHRDTPPPLYLLNSERQSEAFGFLRGTRQHCGFIGREQPLNQLLALLDGEHEHAALAHVHGEAGIGKSRLVLELIERLPARQYCVAQCLPEHQTNALYPILNLLKHQYSLVGLPETQCLSQLTQMIDHTDLNEEHKRQGLLVLSAWLNLPLGQDHALSHLPPELQKRRLFEVVSHLLCHTAPHGLPASNSEPLLFIFEDLHWADPTSKEFIDHLLQTEMFIQGQHAWLNTSREPLPESMATLAFTPIAIGKLDHNQTQAFIDDVFEHQRLAPGLTQLILARTDGIPLFIEELALSLQQQHLVHKVNGIIDFVDHDAKNQVPATLRDSLQQRLDGLQSAKDTAQLAATIGRAFDYDLLVSASAKEEAQLQHDVDELIKAELVYPQRQVEGDSYIFKHALVRDAAYGSMNRQIRQDVHRQIAHLLVSDFPKRVADNPAEAASHYAHSGQCYDASAYYALAADRALTISSFCEAVTYYYDAIEQLDRSQEAHLVDKTALYTQLASVLTMTSGYASDQVEKIQRTISTLKAQQATQNVPQHTLNTQKMRRQAAADCWGQSVFQMVSAHFDAALTITTEYRCQIPDEDYLSQICPHLSEAFIALWQGQLVSADTLLKQTAQFNALALQACGDQFQAECTALYGYNTRVAVQIYRALNHYVLTNNASESQLMAKQALTLARESDHPYTLVHCLCRAALLDIIAADLPSALARANEAQSLAKQCDIALWDAVASLFAGYCEVVLNHSPQGLIDMELAIDEYTATGAVTNTAIYQTLLAEALCVLGDTARAVEICDHVIATCTKNQDEFYLSQTYRVKALAFMNDRAKSAAGTGSHEILQTALAMAWQQQAEGFVHKIKQTMHAEA